MKVVKVLQKGQIVIPKEIREEVGIKIGKRVIVEKIDGGILIIPEHKEIFKAMKGLLKDLREESAVKTVRKLRKDR